MTDDMWATERPPKVIFHTVRLTYDDGCQMTLQVFLIPVVGDRTWCLKHMEHVTITAVEEITA